MVRHSRRVLDVRRTNIPFSSEETESVIVKIREKTGDETLAQSLQFSPTIISNIRRLILNGGTVITDTSILAQNIDKKYFEGSQTQIRCFIDDPEVLVRASTRGTTRAEVALDIALAEPGSKLFIIGSAPAALSRLLAHRQREPLIDVSLICTINGYAAAVPLKERLRESDMAFIVTRGKVGGASAAHVIFESVLETIKEKE